MQLYVGVSDNGPINGNIGLRPSEHKKQAIVSIKNDHLKLLDIKKAVYVYTVKM